MAQQDKVLHYIEKYGSITNYEAFHFFGITRLANAILFLRKRGFPIITIRIEKTDDYGRKVTYGRYVLEKGGNDEQVADTTF